MENLYTNDIYDRKIDTIKRPDVKEDRIRLLESNMLDEIRQQYIYKIGKDITLPFQDGKRKSYFPFPAMEVNEKIKVDVVNHIYEQMIQKIGDDIYEAAKDFYEMVESTECNKVIHFEDKEIKFY